jgi:ribosome biogenesis protein BMS1
MTDQNDRDRYLKYTPEHMHCTATFYGPLVAPNTGILAYQAVSNNVAGFRISLTGIALEQRATPEVVKKLKLVGTPVKIFKNTAFITGMFNSALEVAKFEHAKVKTVSGIRGSIKKAVHDKNDMDGVKNGAMNIGKLQPGTFRATFEDKILMSDIVICRLWVPVEIKKFYNPVLSLLSTTITIAGTEDADPSAGLLMRSTAQLRKDMQIPQVVNKDSVYKPIQRQEREFSKLKIPTKLQESLPFASKPKNLKAKNPKSYLARRAVILEPEERKERGMIQMLSTIKKDKDSKRKSANKQRSAEKQKVLAREKERFEEIHKDEKKRKYKELGLEQQRKMRKLDR